MQALTLIASNFPGAWLALDTGGRAMAGALERNRRRHADGIPSSNTGEEQNLAPNQH